MLRTKLIAAVATVVVAGPAFAGSYAPAPAEPVVMTPAPAPVYTGGDWTGAYGGISLGYGDYDFDPSSSDGMIYGLHAGYDHDFGSFVLGGELEYQAHDFDTDAGFSSDSATRLKLRAGYDAGNTLIYAVAGGVNVDSNMGDDTGYTVGLGAEYKVTDKVSVGAEYLYDDISDFNDSGEDYTGNSISARVNYRF